MPKSFKLILCLYYCVTKIKTFFPSHACFTNIYTTLNYKMSIHNQYFETSHRNVVMEDYNINLVYLTHHFQYKDGMKS